MTKEEEQKQYVRDRLTAAKANGYEFEAVFGSLVLTLPGMRKNEELFKAMWDSLVVPGPVVALSPTAEVIDPATLRMHEDVARDKTLRASLGLASTHFAAEAADPGWDSDYREDQLRDAVCEYADAIRARREANA